MLSKLQAKAAVMWRDAMVAVAGVVATVSTAMVDTPFIGKFVAPLAIENYTPDKFENGLDLTGTKGDSAGGMKTIASQFIAWLLNGAQWVFVVIGFGGIIYSVIRMMMKLFGSQDVRDSWLKLAFIFVVSALLAGTGVGLIIKFSERVGGDANSVFSK